MGKRYIFIIIIFSLLWGFSCVVLVWSVCDRLGVVHAFRAFRRSVFAFDPLKGGRARALRGSPRFPAAVVDLWRSPGSRRSVCFPSLLVSARLSVFAVWACVQARRRFSVSVLLRRWDRDRLGGFSFFGGFQAARFFVGIFGRTDRRTDAGRGLRSAEFGRFTLSGAVGACIAFLLPAIKS